MSRCHPRRDTRPSGTAGSLLHLALQGSASSHHSAAGQSNSPRLYHMDARLESNTP